MFREPKRSTSKQNLSVKATCYPITDQNVARWR